MHGQKIEPVNFKKISETIASSGQPAEEDFEQMAAEGYSTVINLAMAGSDNAISMEGDLVTGAGMNYVHIPVPWESPSLDHFELFAAAMKQQTGKKVWVHCALNMRVSAFLYLYNRIVVGEREEVAVARMHQIWQPNEVWSNFIARVKSAHGFE